MSCFLQCYLGRCQCIFCFSLYHLFSVVAQHSDFSLVPHGRRMMQSQGLPKASAQYFGSHCPDTQVFRVRNELLSLGSWPARLCPDFTEQRPLFRVSCLQFVVWACFVWQTLLFLSQAHLAPSSHPGTTLLCEGNQNRCKL